MRRLSPTCLALAALALAGCSSAPQALDGPTAETQSRIVYGTADTTHTAVVALLNPDGGGYDECSGTIVQVANGIASVLTAAHCCNDTQPTIVIMSSDYSVGVPYINSSNPPAPTYAVITSSVQYDPGYNGNAAAPIDDFCMLQFNAPASTPVIPVATGNDGLAVGTTVEYVGFGTTQNNQDNTLRNHASAPVDQLVTTTYFQYTEGGSTHIGGPCEGDSGGPALLPAGAPQAQQKVVGTTSYGDQACTQYGVSMRVTSQTGPGGFITTYLSGTTSSTSSSSTSSSGGANCAHDLCTAGTKLTSSCDPCVTQVCAADAYCCKTKWDASCVGEVTSVCGESCSGTSSASSSSSSSGGTSCGVTTDDPTCDDCINASCCAQATACVQDASCITCLSSATPPASCNSDQAAIDLATCMTNSCGTPCGTSSTSSSGGTAATGTTGSTSTTSSGVFTGPAGSSGSGIGTTGAGNGGTGTSGKGGEGGGGPGESSSCSVSAGGSAPASPASLAGLLLGAALMISRRRR
jgi:MYXO-CTERM domain-containing protein